MTDARLDGVLHRGFDEFVQAALLRLPHLREIVLMAHFQLIRRVQVLVDLAAHAFDFMADVQRFQEVLARLRAGIDAVDFEQQLAEVLKAQRIDVFEQVILAVDRVVLLLVHLSQF